MNTLNANKIFDVEFINQQTLCLNLLVAVMRGHEVVIWSERAGDFFSIDDDGEESSLLPIDDDAIRPIALESLMRAVETLASVGGDVSNTSRFLLLIGDQRIDVSVEGMATHPPRTIVLRMHGAKEAKEEARAVSLEAMKEVRPPMFLGEDGRILGYGALKFKYRIVEIAKWFFLLCWYAFWIGFACVLFARSPLPQALGVLGWVASVLVGLCLALLLGPYVFGGRKPSDRGANP